MAEPIHGNPQNSPQLRIANLSQLPVDILLPVISWLDVADILRLRQSSKFFQQLTGQYSVWHHAYHTSPHLLRSLPADATALELEQAVIKAERLQRNWSSPFPRVVKSRTIHTDVGPKIRSPATNLALFRGRYLVTHVSRVGLACYDLDAEDGADESPMAVYEDKSTVYRALRDYHEPSGLLTFLKEDRSSGTARLFIVVIKLHLPPQPVSFHLVAEIHAPCAGLQVKVFHDFVAVNGAANVYMWNIFTLRMYKPVLTDSTHRETRIKDYFLTDKHLVINFLSVDETILEAFPLPFSTTQSDVSSHSTSTHEPILIHHSHRTTDSYDDAELTPTLLNKCPSPQSLLPNTFPYTITAIGLTRTTSSASNVLRVKITLHDDGTISVVSVPSIASLSFGYWLLVSSNERCAWGACFSGMTGSDIALVSMGASGSTQRDWIDDEDREGPPVVKSLYKLGEVFTGAHGFAFDGVTGRICVSWDVGKVLVFDFVE